MSKFSTQDIIRFLEGEMDEQERQLFQEELDNDKSLKEDVKLYENISSTLKYTYAPDSNDVKFKSDLEQHNKRNFSSKKPKTIIISFQKYWFAAAAIVIAVLIWAPWNKNLYDNYSKIEMVAVAERGDNSQQLLISATDEFNKKNFKEAREKLKVLVTEKPDDHMLKFYYGITLLETGEIAFAKENFDKVYSGQSIFKYDAAFYNALAYLKENKKEKAKAWLLKIDKDADIYEKAIEVLSKL